MGCDVAMTHRRLIGALVPLTVVLALGACSAGPGGPVPDEVLFDQVAALPGVEDADLRWELNFGNTPGYMGTVTVDDDADAMCVLDQTLSILFQGRQDTSSRAVEVVQDDLTLRAEDLVGDAPLRERYGPPPAGPQPTATVAACAPPAGGEAEVDASTSAPGPGRTPG